MRTFATGWVNDIYAGLGPTDQQPKYGIYGNPNDGTYVATSGSPWVRPPRRRCPRRRRSTSISTPVSGYEQGSVKQFFSIGLVTTATYTPESDGTIKVENAGNYFDPTARRQPSPARRFRSTIPPTPASTWASGFGTPNSRAGELLDLDYDPGYKWAIVSDPPTAVATS